MSNKLTFEEWIVKQDNLCKSTTESCFDKKCINCDYGMEARQSWNFCQAQEQKEIEEFKKKSEELEKRLESAEGVIRFYANWANYKDQSIIEDDCEMLKTFDHKDGEGLVGGKKARTYLKENE